MTDVEERPFMKAQLSDFSLVVLYHAVVLLLLTHSCGGQSQATGPPQPIMAMIGDDIILPCHLGSSGNPLDLTVEWTRPDLEPRFVHLRRDKGDLLDEQNPLYTGRTSLSDNRLKYGDLSLKLSSVSLSDAGTYQCLVPGSTTESMVELVVGSVSSPKIAISKVSNGVLLDCESKGWYPEPEASWLDSKGKLLSTGTSETVKGPDQLYTVSSRVTVEKQHSSSFTCRVQQKNINQTTEAQIHVRDDFFNTQSTTAVRITISLVACFMCLLTVALVAWKIKKTEKCQDKTEPDKNTTSKTLELQLLMAEHKAKEHLMKYLDTAMEKLKEEEKRSEEELKHVEDVISQLKKQKNNLGTQKETVNSTLEVMRKWEEHEKKKKKNEKAEEMGKRIEDQKELLNHMDQLLTDIDEIMMGMTERKGKLETEKQQIKKDTKKTDEKREKVREEVREAEKKIEEVREAEKKREEVREAEKEGARGGSEGPQSEKEEETETLVTN